MAVSSNKVLIANRGEIALRILRACREMGIRSVAVHSTADADAMHVRLADEFDLHRPAAGQRELSQPRRDPDRGEISNAEAIHPGYGFLSENADFAAMVEEHGLIFIGPSPEHIRLMGDKVAAKRAVQAVGIPVVRRLRRTGDQRRARPRRRRKHRLSGHRSRRPPAAAAAA